MALQQHHVHIKTTTTTTILPPPQPQQDVSTSILIQTIGQLEQNIADLEIDRKIEESVKEVVIASVQHAMRAPLRARFKDLPTSNMKEILLQRMLEENYDKGHEDHKMAYAALQKSIIRDESEKFDVDKAEERTKKKSKQDSPKTPPGSPPSPPPPPPQSGASGASGTTGASDSAQDPPPPPPPSSTTNRGYQSHSFTNSPKAIQDSPYLSSNTQPGQRHIQITPVASSVPETYLCMTRDFEAQIGCSEDAIAAVGTFPNLHVPNNNWVSALASSFVPPPENSLLSQTVWRNVTSFRQIKWTKDYLDLEYLRFGYKGDRLALSIIKMKAASYPDVGLEQMVPDQMWAEEEYMYDISASYGISHWTHIRILNVIRIKVFSLYGYDYMKSIVPRRADNQEYTIAESDFKDLYPSDFEDLYLLNLQGHLNHLPPKDKKILSTVVNLWIRNLVIRKWVEDFQLGIESYQTQLNLTKPYCEATGLEFMHDYKILDSPRVVVFKDKFWTKNDVIKSKQFMFAIQKRLKLRRIF
ncbi:hypothetical protein Tco_1044098 [Tanacetum coccineum]|uniref:Uncharacterized protein n=1 Tax=Tanacetum coccineum TaxID=301880 RepID=A0ABQ5GPD7_9ASTR